MKIFIGLMLLGLLLVLCWPIALLMMILFPFVWLVLLPFRLARLAFTLVGCVLKILILIPARILGIRCWC